MQDPYQTLGLSPTAADQEIRQRYLELVRQFPPEREPQRFAEIRAAYERLRDPVVSLETRLFSDQAAFTFADLSREMHWDVRSRRISTDFLLALSDD